MPGSTVNNINFNQNCGGNCQIPDPNNFGNFINVDCKSGLPSGGGGNIPIVSAWEQIKQWIISHKTSIIVVILIIMVVIGALIWWKYYRPRPAPLTLGNKITLNDLFGNFDETLDQY